MFGKLLGGVLGSSIAAESGKSGTMGAVAGMVASTVVRRSPFAALIIGGAWLGHKLYKRNEERKEEQAALAAKPARVAPAPTAPVVPDKPDV